MESARVHRDSDNQDNLDRIRIQLLFALSFSITQPKFNNI